MSDKSWDIRANASQLGPVIGAAAAFSVADVLTKVAFEGGTDPLTLLSARGVIGILLLVAWLRFGAPAPPLTWRMKWVSLALGVLMTGNLFGVFKAVELIPVSIAILIYFVYPLLTGIAGAATGLDRLGFTGAATAVAAFAGLALIIGADPVGYAPLGILAALGGAACRTAMLLVTRAALKSADARRVTLYSLWSSTVLFAALSVMSSDWQWPRTDIGWFAFVGVGFVATAAILAIFVSTQRIGPFRTALYMNLEPLLTALGSAIVLGDHMTPLQISGGAVMIAALCLFQMRR